MSAAESEDTNSNYRLPTNTTMEHACKIAVVEDKPIMLDYWTCSLDKNALIGEHKEINCPRCDSLQTELISQFGSTACKAMYRCTSCLEPFEYFKCL